MVIPECSMLQRQPAEICVKERELLEKGEKKNLFNKVSDTWEANWRELADSEIHHIVIFFTLS